jgi:hypothetical protein
MKIRTIIALSVCGGIVAATLFTSLSQESAQQRRESVAKPILEYATVRFMEDRTSITWPDGTVENVIELSGKPKFPSGDRYPKGADYRMYWLTVAMNIMAKKGYEFVHMEGADVVMSRPPSR